jgi:hypothetical protein
MDATLEMKAIEGFFQLLDHLIAKGGTWGYIGVGLTILGSMYTSLTVSRILLQQICDAFGLDRTRGFLSKVFAFFDKHAYGFGKLVHYCEDPLDKAKEEYHAAVENKDDKGRHDA